MDRLLQQVQTNQEALVIKFHSCRGLGKSRRVECYLICRFNVKVLLEVEATTSGVGTIFRGAKRKRVVLERSMRAPRLVGGGRKWFAWMSLLKRVNSKNSIKVLPRGPFYATELCQSPFVYKWRFYFCVSCHFIEVLRVVAAKRPPCVAANMSGMTSLVVERRCCSAADQLHRTNSCHLHAWAHFSLLCWRQDRTGQARQRRTVLSSNQFDFLFKMFCFKNICFVSLLG